MITKAVERMDRSRREDSGATVVSDTDFFGRLGLKIKKVFKPKEK